ncbi:hypothetical protein F4703DRAFT_1107975 [Phycomyces blakesleeanus]
MYLQSLVYYQRTCFYKPVQTIITRHQMKYLLLLVLVLLLPSLSLLLITYIYIYSFFLKKKKKRSGGVPIIYTCTACMNYWSIIFFINVRIAIIITSNIKFFLCVCLYIKMCLM